MPIITFLVHFFLLLCFLIYFGCKLNIMIISGLFSICGITILSIGIGFLTSSLSIYRKDILYLLPNILQVGMFITPIFFSESLVPDNFKFILYINPIALYIKIFRACLFTSYEINIIDISIACAITLIIVLFSYPLFKRTMEYAADTL